ncbi:DUF3566 domain-containing protein [Prescottella soli]|uniref:DUF3566 domain-containing protein n=1 Tax=Prescottella soli TaxID=1543852 RepID=A0ABW9FXQ3_9NOCA
MSTPRKPGEQGNGAEGDKPEQEVAKPSTAAEAVEAPAPTVAKESPDAAKPADAPKAAAAPKAAEAPESKDAKASQQPSGPADRKPAAASTDAAKGADPQKPAGDKPAAPKPPAQKPGAPTPPWQRGQQQGAPKTDASRPGAPVAGPAGGGKPPAASGQPGNTVGRPGNNGAGKPPTSARPVVTGTAAPKPPAPPTQQPGAPAQHAQPSKPVVTGTAAPKPVVTGTAAPQPPTPNPAPAGPAGGGADRRAASKAAAQSKAAVIDGPTRSIARTDLAKDMPDLSEVRHPSPAPSAGASAPTGALRKAATAALTASAPADGEGLRATVQLRRVDPWSTLKVSLVISIALFFVWMVAVGLLYVVLDGMGVWDRLNNAFTEIISDSNSGGLVTSGQVFGYSALIGLMNVVLFTALATIGSFIYNLCSDLVGGVQVTLADPD